MKPKLNLENAIQRMYWRLSNGKYEPNQNDKETLDFVVDWINRQKEETLREQQLFAKMYIHAFLIETLHFKDIEFGQKSVNELCQKPLSHFIDRFHQNFNNMLFMQYCFTNGIDTKAVSLQSDDEISQIKKKMEDDKGFQAFTAGRWPIEKIESSLKNQVTEAINRYKDLP